VIRLKVLLLEDEKCTADPFAISHHQFITIKTLHHHCILGQIKTEGGTATWSPTVWGHAAARGMESLKNQAYAIGIDCYVIMPNHIHMILKHHSRHRKNHISKFVAACKTHLTYHLNVSRSSIRQYWHPSYDALIIRNASTYNVLSHSIQDHKKNWKYDMLYTPYCKDNSRS
jgi:putative transposase